MRCDAMRCAYVILVRYSELDPIQKTCSASVLVKYIFGVGGGRAETDFVPTCLHCSVVRVSSIYSWRVVHDRYGVWCDEIGRWDARFRDVRSRGGKSLAVFCVFYNFFFLFLATSRGEGGEGGGGLRATFVNCVSGFYGVFRRHWVFLSCPALFVGCGFCKCLPCVVCGGATKSAVDFSFFIYHVVNCVCCNGRPR